MDFVSELDSVLGLYSFLCTDTVYDFILNYTFLFSVLDFSHPDYKLVLKKLRISNKEVIIWNLNTVMEYGDLGMFLESSLLCKGCMLLINQ